MVLPLIRRRLLLAVGLAALLVIDPAAATAGLLYGINSTDDGLSLIDSDTGEVTFIGLLNPGDPGRFATPIGMTIRPSDGTLFAYNNSTESESIGELLTIDPSTGQATVVNPAAPPQGTLGALAFSPGGELYGLGTALILFDQDTGIGTQIGSGLGFEISGADFRSDGVLYAMSGTRELVTVDLGTGVATLVGVLDIDVGTIGSILFEPDGTLIGSGFAGPLGNVLFDIDPATATVSNVRDVLGDAPQGLAPAVVVPEPSTWALAGIGMLALGYASRRRRHA